MNRSIITVSVIFIYLAGTFYSLHLSAKPLYPCPEDTNSTSHSSHCLTPLVSSTDPLVLDLWILTKQEHALDDIESSTINSRKRNNKQLWTWEKLESCSSLQVSLNTPKSTISFDGTNCTIPIPKWARERGIPQDNQTSPKLYSQNPLQAKFTLHRTLDGKEREHIAEALFDLTRLIETVDPAVTLSSSSSSSTSDSIQSIPYYKYRYQSIVLRFVSEYRPFGSVHRSDGVILQRHLFQNRYLTNLYKPLFYVDDNALMHKHQIVLAPPPLPNTDSPPKPPVALKVKFSIISPERDVIHQLLSEGMTVVESMLSPMELDEIRYFLRDEYLYKFVLTTFISTLHLYLDYLAFYEDVQFFRQKTNTMGISLSTIVTNWVCSMILFLYLMDGGGTSMLILTSMGGEILVQGWKVANVIQPKVQFQNRFPFLFLQYNSTFPSTHPHPHIKNTEQSYIQRIEQKTREYDQIAITYLTLFLYPIIVGMGIYALQYDDNFTTYSSWLISNLANAVYTFGFIAQCPQLYVNYRLQSVAHLPMRVFIYKIFNTFIDDFFAFLIAMPWKHRIMTLRDDVVFAGFLCQAYWYRVDKARPNEFGYVYEIVKESEKNDEIGKDSEENGEIEKDSCVSSSESTNTVSFVDRKKEENRVEKAKQE